MAASPCRRDYLPDTFYEGCLSFLFPKRATTAEDDRAREAANRQEFDALAEAIRVSYGQAPNQPQATLDSVNGLLARVKTAKKLDKRQREILKAYIYDAAGYANLELGKINEGLAAMEKAARTYEALPDKTLMVNNLMNRSRAWLMRNDLKQALVFLERGLEMAKEGRLSQLETDVLYKLGVLFTLTGQNDRAQEIFGRGLLLAQQTGNQDASASFLSQFGQLYLQKGDYEKAEDYFDRSGTMFEQLQDLDNLLVSYGQLDQLYRRRGEYQKALEFAAKGLELARQQANQHEENVFLQDLALIHQARQDFSQAGQMAHQSLDMARALKDHESQMRAYSLLTEIALSQKDFEAAQASAQKGLELAQANANQRELAIFLNDFAEIKLGQGDIPAALAYFERLAALFKAMGDKAMLATLYVRMGDTRLQLQNDPQGAAGMAEQSFELALGQADSETSMFAFTSTMRLLQLLAVQKYYEEGLKVAGRCLERANAELANKTRDKRSTPSEQGRWLLFVQVLIVLVATLQDLKTGKMDYQAKVKDILAQLAARFGDTFTLETWTAEMYERLK
jgi:tetratricopeptide (TPR) repeat protein